MLIVFAGILKLSGNNKEVSFNKNQSPTDSSLIVTFKARFVGKISSGSCGWVYLPEKNLFEKIEFDQNKILRTRIAIEYYNNCKASNFFFGQTYLITAKNGCKGCSSYTNIKTVAVKP